MTTAEIFDPRPPVRVPAPAKINLFLHHRWRRLMATILLQTASG